MSLTSRERRNIERSVGDGIIISAAIGKVLFGSPNKNIPVTASKILQTFPQILTCKEEEWIDTDTFGGLVFVKRDETVSLEVYQLKSFKKMFSYDLYYNFQLNKMTPMLYAFEMEECMGGLLFTAEDVARLFVKEVFTNAPMKNNFTARKNFFNFMGTMLRTGSRGNDSSNTSLATVKSPAFIEDLRKIAKKEEPKETLQIERDGTINIEAVPSSWKILFFDTGFSKKDLKKPELVREIVRCLEEDQILASFRQIPGLANASKKDLSFLIDADVRNKFRSFRAKPNRKPLQEIERTRKPLEELVKSFKGTKSVPPEIMRIPSPPKSSQRTERESEDKESEEEFDKEFGPFDELKVRYMSEESFTKSLNRSYNLHKNQKLPPYLPNLDDIGPKRKHRLIEKLKALRVGKVVKANGETSNGIFIDYEETLPDLARGESFEF